MEYRVITAMNNNVVLGCNDVTQEQVVLMSKGIGFGRKVGDMVSDDGDNRQIFKLWTEEKSIRPILADQVDIEDLVRSVVKLAEERLGTKNPKLYDALLDHIQFSIDRLRFGLPIENPFTHETSILYEREYEVASTAVQMIQSRMHVDMGEAEIGFIALHLHSAAKDGPLDTSIQSVQLYKNIMLFLKAEAVGDESSRRVFLQSLFGVLDMVRHGVSLHFPFSTKDVKALSQSVVLAARICKCAEDAFRITLDKDTVCFVTMDIEKLRQASAG